MRRRTNESNETHSNINRKLMQILRHTHTITDSTHARTQRPELVHDSMQVCVPCEDNLLQRPSGTHTCAKHNDDEGEEEKINKRISDPIVPSRGFGTRTNSLYLLVLHVYMRIRDSSASV